MSFISFDRLSRVIIYHVSHHQAPANLGISVSPHTNRQRVKSSKLDPRKSTKIKSNYASDLYNFDVISQTTLLASGEDEPIRLLVSDGVLVGHAVDDGGDSPHQGACV